MLYVNPNRSHSALSTYRELTDDELMIVCGGLGDSADPADPTSETTASDSAPSGPNGDSGGGGNGHPSANLVHDVIFGGNGQQGHPDVALQVMSFVPLGLSVMASLIAISLAVTPIGILGITAASAAAIMSAAISGNMPGTPTNNTTNPERGGGP